MGLKALRAHFRVPDAVYLHYRRQHLCVGDADNAELAVFTMEGRVAPPATSAFALSRRKDGLGTLCRTAVLEPATLKRLLEVPEAPMGDIEVYSAVHGQVITHRCERYAPGAVTDAGELIDSSTHHLLYARAVADAKKQLATMLRYIAEKVENHKAALQSALNEQEEAAQRLAALSEEYPCVAPST